MNGHDESTRNETENLRRHAARVADALRKAHPAPTNGSEDSLEGEAVGVILRLLRALPPEPPK